MQPTHPIPPLDPLHPILAQHFTFPLYLGDLTLIVGSPGAGKSLLALDLAARAAAGSPHPPLHPSTPLPPYDSPDTHASLNPGAIVYLSSEGPDAQSLPLEFGIHPSLLLIPPFGCESIIPESYAHYEKKNAQQYDAPLIRWLREKVPQKIRLIIFDPLRAFIGSVYASPYTIQRRLIPLLDYCHARNIALVGISHTTKSHRSLDPVHLSLGSNGFPAYARSVLYLTRDPNNPKRRLLIPIKNNLAPITQAYAFSFKDRPRRHPYFSRPIPPELAWEPDPITQHPLLLDAPFTAPLESEEQRFKSSRLDFACEFLKTTLAQGPLPSATLQKESRKIGISLSTLERARILLNIRPYQKNHQWLAQLPTPTPP